MELEIGGHRHRVDVRREGRVWRASVDGQEFLVDACRAGDRWSLLLEPGRPRTPAGDGAGARSAAASYEVALDARGAGAWLVRVDGHLVALSRVGAGRADQTRGTRPGAPPRDVVAPMPGRVVKILVKPGDEVQPRQPLVIVEAMKMENELRAAEAGIVAEVRVVEGALVEARTVLVTMR